MKWLSLILLILKQLTINCSDCPLNCQGASNHVNGRLLDSGDSASSKCSFLDDDLKHLDTTLSVKADCVLIATAEAGFRISWQWNSTKSVNVNKYILIFKKPNKTLCYEFGKDDRKYCYTDKTDECSELTEITVVGVSKENKALSKGNVQPEKCPSSDIYVKVKPSHRVVEVGSSVSITCDIQGFPQPSPNTISWFYTHEKSCKRRLWRYLSKSKHVMISKDKRFVEIDSVSSKDQGCYICEANNEINEDEGRSVLVVKSKIKESDKLSIHYIILVIAGIFVLLSLVLLFIWRFKWKNPHNPLLSRGSSVEITSSCVLYISHCSKNEKSKKRILKLADVFQREIGVKVVMDILCHVAINDVGGMYNWVPNAMKGATKVALILSKDYLETLESNDQNNENVRKVHAEVKEVKQMIYEELQQHSRIVLIIDGADESKLPPYFQSKSYFEFPKSLNSSDKELNRIVAVLYDEERLQLATPSNNNEIDVV